MKSKILKLKPFLALPFGFWILFGIWYLILGILHVPHVRAGFGATPPYVRNHILRPGQEFRQEIMLVRSDPARDLIAQISLDVGDIASWVRLEPAASFPLPALARQIPFTVVIAVPTDAAVGMSYAGAIRVRAVSPEGGSGVSVVEGARIDMDLAVTDEEFMEFNVRRVDIPPLNEGHPFLWAHVPGRIDARMAIENTGNVPARPSRVTLDMYNANGKVFVASLESSALSKALDAFRSGTVTASFPTNLAPGSYKTEFKVYNDSAVVYNGTTYVTIHPYGTIEGDYGYIAAISLRDKLIVASVVIVVMLGIVLVVWSIRKRRKYVLVTL